MGARLRYNGLSTTLGGSLTNVATSVTFAGALTHSNGTNVPTITGTDYIPLVILGSTNHLSEIVYLTAYTAAATTGTISRGQEGTTGAAHSSGDTVIQAAIVADANPMAGFSGDASSGDVTISGTTTLTGDVFYDTLIVQNGGTLITAGYRVNYRTLCQVDSGGTIHRNGTNAASATGAAALGQNTIGGSGVGASGTTTAGGTGAGVNNAYGSAGGAGGLGASGAGGSGATVSLFNNPGQAHSLPQLSLGYFMGTTGSTGAQQIVASAGITVNSSSILAGVVTVWVQGATPVNSTQTLTCRITTNQGRTDDRTIQLFVNDR